MPRVRVEPRFASQRSQNLPRLLKGIGYGPRVKTKSLTGTTVFVPLSALTNRCLVPPISDPSRPILRNRVPAI